MRVVLQRVSQAIVEVSGASVGEINSGLLLFVAVAKGDNEFDVDELVDKICKLKIFTDGGDSFMENNIIDMGGSLLVVSQFTLYGKTNKGTKPDFSLSAPFGEAEQLYEYFIRKCLEKNIHTESGRFGDHMEISLINDGPVTLILDSTHNNII